ncbi:hypothetical protein MNBD_GAMMA09-3489 [hydrothermal vent metagenome]|uniref:DUF5666 domain-containing protein n=1 Tax=hydrothermal vent metagenome TaxID=652676 RepID=A0A3B0XSW7_9ZZZZ
MNLIYSKNYFRLIAAALLASIIAACSGIGSGLAGIGGSGFVSTGSVSGFGSVFVNGIEFNTDSATFEIDDASGSQQDLSIGMVVQVKGSINADGKTGTATRIRYGNQMEGPVDSTIGITTNADNTQKTFSVLGNKIIVDAVNTVFKGANNFSFDTIAANNAVEISGFYDQNGDLQASYIELKSAVFNPLSSVEIEGTIKGLTGSSFSVRNISIDAAAANLTDFTNGLQNGVYVEVKGIYNNNSAAPGITATEVDADDISLNSDADEVNIEGFVTRYIDNSDFDINGIPVNASAASFEPASLQQDIGNIQQPGMSIKVEAEGAIVNGILIATNIESRRGNAEIHALMKSKDIAGNTMTISIASTDIVVAITSSTTLEDDQQDIDSFSLSDIQAGDFVEIVGFETDTSGITATKIKRSDPSEFNLQGFATSASGLANNGTITVLGATFNFSGATNFKDTSEMPMNMGAIDRMITDINSTPQTLVKIAYDNNQAPNFATSINLE